MGRREKETSEKKQIVEEMARHIPARIFAYDVRENSAKLDELNREIVALHLYRAGYRKQSGWISVEERLPDLYGTYLIHTCNNHVKLGRFCEWAIGFAPSFDDYTVTHWMPLPEPPKGD